jgi:hypothetical protein
MGSLKKHFLTLDFFSLDLPENAYFAILSIIPGPYMNISGTHPLNRFADNR